MVIKRCSVIGLGKLGACMAVAIASKGFKVIGVDKNFKRIKAFNQKRAPIFEPNLEKLLKKYGHRIIATADYETAVLGSDITFIVVPTPSKSDGEFSLHYVKQAATKIARALSKKDSYHMIVLTSTVLPGSTESCIKPILEIQSRKKCGRDFGLCYNPEFIALGTVIHNFLNPDFVLIGEFDKKAGKTLEVFYKKICENNPPIARMNLVNAELTKIAVNSFVTTKITFANMLSELAERLEGADVDVVTQALELDSRIGRRYLKGGLGYGGPCFPRDNIAMAALARKFVIRADIPLATDRFNRRILSRLFKIVRSKTKKGRTVGILGLAYKPLTNVMEESQGALLAAKLIKSRVRVVLYDPLANESMRRLFRKKARYATSAKELLSVSDVIVIATPDAEFYKLKASDFRSLKRPLVVIDCWRVLRNSLFLCTAPLEYISFGIGPCKMK